MFQAEDELFDLIEKIDSEDSRREGDEMDNPLEETPELEAELDDLEAELGDSVEPEPTEEPPEAEPQP